MGPIISIEGRTMRYRDSEEGNVGEAGYITVGGVGTEMVRRVRLAGTSE